jgi:hypothetical protein
MKKGGWDGCDVYVARSRLRKDGTFGDFVKYYNGAFCEAGNLGRESAIAQNAWHPRVVYFQPFDCYIMSSVKVQPGAPQERLVEDVMYIRTSTDMLHWSEPIPVMKDGKEWGNHYVALANTDDKTQPYILTNKMFCVLTNHNGTDVTCYPIEVIEK